VTGLETRHLSSTSPALVTGLETRHLSRPRRTGDGSRDPSPAGPR